MPAIRRCLRTSPLQEENKAVPLETSHSILSKKAHPFLVRRLRFPLTLLRISRVLLRYRSHDQSCWGRAVTSGIREHNCSFQGLTKTSHYHIHCIHPSSCSVPKFVTHFRFDGNLFIKCYMYSYALFPLAARSPVEPCFPRGSGLETRFFQLLFFPFGLATFLLSCKKQQRFGWRGSGSLGIPFPSAGSLQSACARAPEDLGTISSCA